MSFDTDKTWLYQIVGRNLQLWQYVQTSNTDTLQGYKIKLPNSYYGNKIIYPNEDITNGLRIEYTALNEPFVAEALETTTARASGTGISFDPGPAATISDTGDGFSDFAQGDKIRVIGSASNDGDYTLSSSGTVDEDTLTITGTFTTEAAGESVTVYQIHLEDSSPSETSHVNLNRMLSLACVDYVKAMSADLRGEIDRKEYYMREFWKKIGDNDSNKRKIAMLFPSGSYSVR
jgi:hypothetical protein|tara:strand:+ start:594 stop:1292 length:699 start_codon:yes stop_codon:yes gene_type:complete